MKKHLIAFIAVFGVIFLSGIQIYAKDTIHPSQIKKIEIQSSIITVFLKNGLIITKGSGSFQTYEIDTEETSSLFSGSDCNSLISFQLDKYLNGPSTNGIDRSKIIELLDKILEAGLTDVLAGLLPEVLNKIIEKDALYDAAAIYSKYSEELYQDDKNKYYDILDEKASGDILSVNNCYRARIIYDFLNDSENKKRAIQCEALEHENNQKWENAGFRYHETGKFQKAIEMYEKAITCRENKDSECQNLYGLDKEWPIKSLKEKIKYLEEKLNDPEV